MSNYNPFGEPDVCVASPKLFPVNTKVKRNCLDTDGLHKAISMIRGVYDRLADPTFGSKLIAYTEDQTVQEVLQYLVDAIGNGGGGGGSYDDTELRLLISSKLAKSEFSLFTDELEILLESKVDKEDGKQLSDENFTTIHREKLESFISGDYSWKENQW